MEGNTILSYVEGMETPSLEAIYTWAIVDVYTACLLMP